MSRYCGHGNVVGRCPEEEPVGYVPPEPPFRANLDRHGMPRDYATYVWLLYRQRVQDDSPARRAFLERPGGDYGQQVGYR